MGSILTIVGQIRFNTCYACILYPDFFLQPQWLVPLNLDNPGWAQRLATRVVDNEHGLHKVEWQPVEDFSPLQLCL